ncbi:MAG: hypothetical protein J3K34DRAFT_425152 [Monoraphidium minutum]|nr:MAG: hypothetical protein J3K34DRAFT_425152 [Monoraphidium minutum]
MQVFAVCWVQWLVCGSWAGCVQVARWVRPVPVRPSGWRMGQGKGGWGRQRAAISASISRSGGFGSTCVNSSSTDSV